MRPSLVEELLADQQNLTAVEQFAHAHDAHAFAPGARYRNLIPVEAPRAGEQYAFEVELDKCSGCKACVTACHSLNGLDDNETWREVGLLIPEPKRRRCDTGGTSSTSPRPFTHNETRGGRASMQHVTTACHHCIDPACLNGCPVLAYEKDPLTGIVRHLDDQCIGCQYCVLKCPYDVPKYNARLGIVRKCDMCANRLAAGEAPACVQACPNEAIRITKVEAPTITIRFRERSQPFLSGAPAGDYTLPTTRYISGAESPKLVAADAATWRPQPAHWPLVLMLALSQASAGVACAAAVARQDFLLLAVALSLGIASMVASVFHLGRPLGAWRFFLGLKRSWLSREILAFGVFVPLLAVACVSAWFSGRAAMDLPSPVHGERIGTRGDAAGRSLESSRIAAVPTPRPDPLPVEGRGNRSRSMLGGVTAIVGLLGVFCSIMIYHDTRRVLWRARRTGSLFLGTTALLGLAAWFALDAKNELVLVLFAAALVSKLLIEISVARHVVARELTSLKKTALLIAERFQYAAMARVLCAATGMGMALLLNAGAFAAHPVLAFLPFALVLAGEILERMLFFRTVDAPKMPGGIAA